MTIEVDQSRLVMNAFAAHFQNNLTASDLVTWRKYDGEMNDRNGLTVSEQKPPRYVVTRTTDDIQDLTGGPQTTVMGSEMFRIRDTFGTSMGWDDFQKIRDFESARESEALKAAALQLAEQIDAYIIRTLVLNTNNWVGNGGASAPIQEFSDVAAAFVRLKKEGVDDADIRAVLDYDDWQALGNYITDGNGGGNATSFQMAEGVFRSGFQGKIAGIPTLFTQQLPTLITGTRTNGTVNGAGQNVNYRAAGVAESAAPGQYLTQTLNITGIGGTNTIRDGEVFTIAGVFAYDNRLQAPLTHLQQFRVIGDATATAGAATVRIFPAIIVPGTGTGADININTAHATVSAVPASGAAVTFIGAASALLRPRIVTKKNAVIASTRDLILPATGQGSRMTLKKVPISVRMWKDSQWATGDHRVRFDTVITVNSWERRHGVRLNGA